MLKLVIEDDEGKTTVVPIIREEITIGRKDGNTIRLTERNVSRRHAKLSKANGVVQIEDVESRYGTKLNGKVIAKGESHGFREGDVVVIGDYRLSIQSDRKPEDAPAPGLQRDRKPDVQPPKVAAAPAAEISPEEAAKLVVVSSNFAGREFSLTGIEMIIGRTEGDIRLDHRSISRNHAKIVRDGDRYKVLDLNSANGVKVNGEEYRSVQLKRGDVIELGHVRFRFVEPGESFVFSPSSVSSVEDDEPIRSGSGNAVKFIVAGVLAMLVIGVVILIGIIIIGNQMTGDKGTGGKVDAGVATTTPPDNDTDDSFDEVANERADEDTAELLKEANTLAGDEQWSAAIRLYNLVLKKDPDSAEAREGKSKASLELPFKRHYDDGKKALDAKRFEEAENHFRAISSVSMYSKRVEEEGLREKAKTGLIDRYLTECREFIRKRDWQDARDRVQQVLDLDPSNEKAKDLRREINRRSNDGGTVADNKPDKGKPDKGDKKPDNNTKKPDDGGKLSKDEVRERRKALIDESRRLILTGNPDAAIPKIQEAISKYGAGIQGFKMLALAYEKKGDNGNAVKYYNKWLQSSCNNRLAPVVRKKIVAMGGTPSC